jgi:hypothetical protein
MRFVAFLATLIISAPPMAARAQSSLGLNAAEFGLAYGSGESENAASGTVAGDFRITGAHGLQLGLGFADQPGGGLGQVDLHLYLLPSPLQKYGFVLSLADADGREATIGYTGVEGIFQLGASTFASGQAVLGYARPGDIDFIGFSGGLVQALSDTTAIFATLDLAEFDEESLRTTAYAGRIGVSYQPDQSQWEISAAVATDGLTEMGASEETRLELALAWRFGATGGARRPVGERLYRPWQPFDPLLRRGLF